MRSLLKTDSTLRMMLVALGISLFISTLMGCRTTHHFRTETLKHSSYNTDTITLEVAEW